MASKTLKACQSRSPRDQYPSFTAEMYPLRHNARCVCLCPAHALFSSIWPLYQQTAHKCPKCHDHRLYALTGEVGRACQQILRSSQLNNKLELHADLPKDLITVTSTDLRNKKFAGNYNWLERVWKSMELFEYKQASKTWEPVSVMPKDILRAHFQFKSFDTIHAVSYEGRVVIKRRDGFLQGAVYDFDKNAWDTDWRIPKDGVSWFAAMPPAVHKELVVPWEKCMLKCHTYVAPERGRRRIRPPQSKS